MTESEWLVSTDAARMLEWAANRERFRSVTKTTGPQGMWPPMSDRKLRLWIEACYLLSGEKNHEVERGLRDGWPNPIADVAAGWARTDDEAQRAVRAALLRDVVGNPFRPVRLPEITAGKRNARGKLISDMPSWWDHPSVAALALAAYEERAGRACGRCGGRGEVVQKPYPHHQAGLFICLSCGGGGTVSDGTLDPGRLEILADAAESAGCDDALILNHLRGRERCPYCDGTGSYSDANDMGLGGGYRGCTVCDVTGWIPKRGPCVRGCWCVDLLLGRE